MAMMNVSRSWPSGTIGRTGSTAPRRSTSPAAGCSPAASRPSASGAARAAPRVHGSVPGSATVIATARPSRASSAPAPNGSPKTPGSERGRCAGVPRRARAADAHRRRRPRPLAETQARHGRLAQRVDQRPPQHFVDQPRLEEPHLRLGRVDVDVDAVRRQLEEQVDLGAALADRRGAVGVDDRVLQRPVADDAAVDEDVLRPADRALLGQRRHEAGDADARRLAEQLDQIGPLAEHLVDAIAQRRRRRTLQDAAAARTSA